MRIPTSVIVMSLLTAAPFAMAVRDTVNGKDEPALDADDDWGEESISSERERELLAEYEAERARELEERERQKRENVARLDKLFDASVVAQMGPLLDGVMLGGASSDAAADALAERFEREMPDGFATVELGRDIKRVQSVTVTVDHDRSYDSAYGVVDDLCQTFKDKLVAAWGPSTNSVWANPGTYTRASLARDTCSLTFEQVLSADEWVKTVAFDALGKPAEKYLEKYQAASDVIFEEYDDDLARWFVPGVGFSRGATEHQVFIENNKIVGARSLVDTDFDSIVAIRDAISAKLNSSAALRPAPVTPDIASTTKRCAGTNPARTSGRSASWIAVA